MSVLEEVEDIYVVCECMDVKYGEILKAIKEGNCDLESLMDATDAGTACGKCRSREDDPDEERAIHLDEILVAAKGQGLCPEEK
ncbi:MAG TPA: (2Fe-2S)-binding protein [Nitratifractor salsuginis]|uniref:(2Fe-2S)-binding protein n=1 Tax=Nitratifractor salsuginis TaxID=269261 RepID=A0A7V2WMA7_9BACT|nr:(2Fe-2S)-binding protein [Nitratifractor salsuginis]